MGFGKKNRYSFLDIIRGIQHAVNASHNMLQAQQLQSLQKFWDEDNGKPVSKTIKVKDGEFSVPLVALLPHNHLGMDDVERPVIEEGADPKMLNQELQFLLA